VIEFLVVLVIVGVLAAIVTFAVRGAVSDAEDSACAADGKILRDAEEAYSAQHGRYATETELVDSGLLRRESTLNNIVAGPGNGVTVVTLAACTVHVVPADRPAATLAATTAPSTTTSTTTTSTTTTSPATTTTTTTTLPPSTSTSTTTTSTPRMTSTSTTTSTTLPV